MSAALLRPGIRLMQLMKLPAKFALISAAFMLPMGIAVYSVIGYATDSGACARAPDGRNRESRTFP